MQIKTIQKAIATKLNEWLETIKDEGLRKSVKSNLLVSGGSITSMLLSEQVNDFDIYIMDINVLVDLTKYYTQEFKDVVILDGRVKDNLVKEIEKRYEGFQDKEFEEIHTAYKISLDNLKADQIKLFFESAQGNKRVNEDKTAEELKYEPTFFSPNAISLSNQIQIVIRFWGDAEAIHKTFDYIHATNYFTFENGLVTNIKALESILTKQLYYQGSLYPLTSIIRMKKFLKRGWNITAGEILKIMFQISELNLKDPNVLEEQLIGVDVAYFDLIIKILRGAGEETITSHWLNTIIDKVFNSAE